MQNACTDISADIPALRFEVEVMNESHHGPWVGGCPLEWIPSGFPCLKRSDDGLLRTHGHRVIVRAFLESFDRDILRVQGAMGTDKAVHP